MSTSIVRAGFEDDQPALLAAQIAALESRSEALVAKYAGKASRPVAFVDVKPSWMVRSFIAMEALPDEVVAHSNSKQRFQGVGRYAKDIDLDAEPMKSLVATMAQRKITVDPTLSIFEEDFVPEAGELGAAYAPYVGRFPPAIERHFRDGGFAPEDGATRADFRASFRKLQELVGRMHKAGVPIVAGTDDSGFELVRELELYVESGFTVEEAIAAATIEPARLVGAASHTGSIAVGKDADLVLVDGDPARHIGDLRRVSTVMMDGRLIDARKLQGEVGMSAVAAELMVD